MWQHRLPEENAKVPLPEIRDDLTRRNTLDPIGVVPVVQLVGSRDEV
jgi:hypothetical protein